MKKGLFLLVTLVTCHILMLQTASSQWVRQYPPAGTGNLYSVFAINANSVAASGFQGVWRTFNGGTTWANPLPVSGIYYYSVHTAITTRWYSLPHNTAWYLQVDNPGTASLLCCHPDNIYSLHFYNPSCGVAVGASGKIVMTCDTGNTFTTLPPVSPFTLYSVWIAANGTGCACGALGTILLTTNGGSNWATVTSPVNQSLNGIHFPTNTVAYIVGNSGTILKSTNGGSSWTVIPTSITNDLYGVYFNNADTGYVVGSSGLILQTMDGGMVWRSMNSGTSQTLHSVNFVSTRLGWIVGDSAMILKYDSTITGLSANLEPLSLEMNVFPNPASHNIVISVQSKASVNTFVGLSDITGRCLRTIHDGMLNKGETRFYFDASSLDCGLYFMLMKNENMSEVMKFLKD